MKLSFALLTMIAFGCGGSKPAPATTTEPTAATATIVGDFTRQDPEHPTVLRFAEDGSCLVSSDIASVATPSHRCTWKLDGTRLTFTNTEGTCAEPAANVVGVYEVVLTPTQVTFKVVEDKCDSRLSIDGQTWIRAKA
jgi:hypothetical protein